MTDTIVQRLRTLIIISLILGVGHHFDHAIRGNHVGWPLNGDVNPFTFSLSAYPVYLYALVLLARRSPYTMPYVAVASPAFALLVTFVHLTIEPPQDIIAPHSSLVVGYFAFAWLVALVISLYGLAFYAGSLWMRQRRTAPA
ncbi:MAG: hypothetical protein SF162_16495 [bacterium]|nr:hypothetical protein [bacterium]